jgi:hypothetical protein
MAPLYTNRILSTSSALRKFDRRFQTIQQYTLHLLWKLSVAFSQIIITFFLFFKKCKKLYIESM